MTLSYVQPRASIASPVPFGSQAKRWSRSWTQAGAFRGCAGVALRQFSAGFEPQDRDYPGLRKGLFRHIPPGFRLAFDPGDESFQGHGAQVLARPEPDGDLALL